MGTPSAASKRQGRRRLERLSSLPAGLVPVSGKAAYRFPPVSNCLAGLDLGTAMRCFHRDAQIARKREKLICTPFLIFPRLHLLTPSAELLLFRPLIRFFPRDGPSLR